MHSVVTGTAHEYISDLVTPVSELGGRVHLRLAAQRRFVVPRTRTFIGSKALSVASPTTWKNLPPSIRYISSATAFKCHLIAHLFNCAYVLYCIRIRFHIRFYVRSLTSLIMCEL